MSLEHEKAGKVVTREMIIENAVKSVKVGDTVAYVGEDGIGREAHVVAISGTKADLDVILPDGQLKHYSGIDYLDSRTPDEAEGAVAGNADEAAKSRAHGRRGKHRKAAKSEKVAGTPSPDALNAQGKVVAAEGTLQEGESWGESGERLDENGEPVVPRDIQRLRDTAILYKDQGGAYWHV